MTKMASLLVAMTVGLRIYAADGDLSAWMRTRSEVRPKFPTTYVAPKGDSKTLVRNSLSFEAEEAVAQQSLPDSTAARSWKRVVDAQGEILSVATIQPTSGVTWNFAVYNQLGNLVPYYWTGTGYPAASGSDLSAASVERTREILGSTVACSQMLVATNVLSKADTGISMMDGTSVVVPFERAYLVFVDDRPCANWAHPCRYVFFNEDLSEFAVSYQSYAPRIRRVSSGERLGLKAIEGTADVVPLKEITDKVYSAANAMIAGVTANQGDVSRSHFVLISGGGDPENNGIRFWADTAMLYSTFTRKYGVPKSQIHVLMSDGGDPNADANLNDFYNPVLVDSPTDLDGDGEPDVDGAATWANMNNVFTNTLAKVVTADSQVFVFIVSHGSANGTAGVNNHSCLAYLYSTAYSTAFNDYELAKMTKSLPCPVAFAIETCYSGGFIDDLTATPDRVVLTACDHYESSLGTGGQSRWGSAGAGSTCAYDTWAVALAAAVRGRWPANYDATKYVFAFPWNDGASADADANGDGLVSMEETFAFAWENDECRCTAASHTSCRTGSLKVEHPQFAESTAGLGAQFYVLKQNGGAVDEPPDNDDFANAVTLVGAAGQATGSNVRATTQAGEPLPKKYTLGTNTVWWTWTAPSAGTASFSTAGTGFDTVMGVYVGDVLSSLGVIKEDDDGGASRTSVCTFDCVAGKRYYIAVAGWGNSAVGTIKLNWSLSATEPASDFVISGGVLTKYTGAGGDVTVPSGVTQIGSHAFEGSALTSVTLPDSLVSLGTYAFYKCQSLTNVTFGGGLKDIGKWTFCSCSKLKGTFSVPEGVTNVAFGAFMFTGVNTLVFPSSLRALGAQLCLSSDWGDVWFRGNAPSLPSIVSPNYPEESSPFCSASANLVVHVPQGSTGWKDATSALPSKWPLQYTPHTIVNYTGEPPSGTCTRFSGSDIQYADSISDFEDMAAEASVTTGTCEPTSGGAHWFAADATDNDSMVEDYDSLDVPMYARTCGLPGGLSGQGTRYLSFKTLLSSPLWRTVNPLVGATVQPRTVGDVMTFDFLTILGPCDEMPSIGDVSLAPNGTPHVSNAIRRFGSVCMLDDKLSVFLLEDEFGEDVTLCVLAGARNATTGQIEERLFQYSPAGLDAETWNRVTIKAMTVDSQLRFLVYFNGELLSDDAYYARPQSGTELSISALGFAGSGCVDNIFIGEREPVFDDDDPEPILPEGVSLQTVDGIDWIYRISNGQASVGSGTYDLPAVPIGTVGDISIPAKLGGVPVTGVDDYAFQNCAKLTGVTIPASVRMIGGYAFSGCASLASAALPSGLLSIGNQAFEGCAKLTSAAIPAGVEQVGYRAFANCYALTDVTLPSCVDMRMVFERDDEKQHPCLWERVTLLGDWESVWGFEGMTSLVSVTLPGSVREIGSYAFRNCTSLERVTIQGGSAVVGSGGGGVVGSSAFEGCVKLTSVSIPAGVEAIEDSAFRDCAKLANVTIPESVREVGDQAFYGCASLTSVNIPKGVWDAKRNVRIGGVERIGNEAFCGCSGLTSLELPECAEYIGAHAFAECLGLRNVVLSKWVFYSGGLRNVFYVDEYFVGEGCYHGVCGSVFWETVVIGDGVESVEGFSENANLRSVTLPSSVKCIGEYAFRDCPKLERVTIVKGQSAAHDLDPDRRYVGWSAFENCVSLTYVDIPEGVRDVYGDAFSGCVKLASVKLPVSVREIWDRAFKGCRSLTDVDMPEAVWSDEWRDFTGGVTDIRNEAFYGCCGLTSVRFPQSLRRIGGSAFEGCKELRSLVFDGNAPQIDGFAFDGLNPSCTAWVKIGSTGWDAEIPGVWGWRYPAVHIAYRTDLPPVLCGPNLAATQSDGRWTISSATGSVLTDADLSSVKISATLTGGAVVDVTKGYKVVRSADGKSATLLLKTPEVGVQPDAGETENPADDPSGMLVEVDESELATKPEAGEGESVGALPVKAVKGLWYQASWGGGLQGLTQGEKVQATGDSLYLGVIKQTGASGFYRLSVSEK